jgi:hypothetical protein
MMDVIGATFMGAMAMLGGYFGAIKKDPKREEMEAILDEIRRLIHRKEIYCEDIDSATHIISIPRFADQIVPYQAMIEQRRFMLAAADRKIIEFQARADILKNEIEADDKRKAEESKARAAAILEREKTVNALLKEKLKTLSDEIGPDSNVGEDESHD